MTTERKIAGLIVILIIISGICVLNFPEMVFSKLLFITTILLINWFEGRDALKSVRVCIRFLLYNTVLIGLTIVLILNLFGVIDEKSLWMFVIFALSYILVWIFVILKADNQVAKLSTMVIGQAFTIFYLVGSFIINILPVQMMVKSGIELDYLISLGYTVKDIFNIFLQILFYPVLVVALTTYVIVELKDYKQKKSCA